MKRGVFLVLSCLLMASVFAGAAGALLGPLDVNMFAAVGPPFATEKTPTDFSLSIYNNLDSTDSICNVNLTASNFTVLDATSKVNWSYTITSWGIYWSTSSCCISNDGSENFRFRAESADISSNITAGNCARKSSGLPMSACNACKPIPGRATCANWKISSNVRWS